MENLADLEISSKSAFTEFNVRQEQGKPHFVRLHDGVVKRLEGRLEQGGCGLLLGSIEPGEGCTISVEEFEPAVQIEERLKTWRAPAGSGRQVVGYYHSHSRAGFTLEPPDRALFERCFPAEKRLLLLVKPPLKPPKAEVGTAMFFLGEAGQLLADRATVEFPFNLRELGAEDAPPQPETGMAAPIKALAKAVAPTPQPPVAPVKPKSPAPPVSAVKTTTPAPAPPTPAKAKTPRGAGLLWKIAIAAVVVIASGFGLSELKVFDHQQPQPAPVAVEASAPAAAPQEFPAAREKESPKPAETTPLPSAKAPAQPAPAVGKAASPVTPAKTASQPPAPSEQPVLVAQNPTPAPNAPVQPAAEIPTPKPLPDPPPAIRQQSPPTQPATQPAPLPAVVPAAPSVPITPPHAIQQVAPELPAKALKSLVGEVVVRMKVNVDASGRVTSIEPVGAIDPAVAGAVSSAVKRWKFAPARRGSENVPGDLVLSFVFRK